MASGNKLGDAYVDLSARVDKLEADLKEARATTEREAQAMGDSVDRHVTEKWKEASSKVTSFIGSVTAMIGVGFVFERLGEKIGKVAAALRDTSQEAAAFRQDISRLSLDQINKQLDDLYDTTESGAANLKDYALRLTDYFGITDEASRTAQIALLEQARAAEQARDASERLLEIEKQRLDAAKALAESRAGLRDETQQAFLASLDGEELVRAEYELNRRKLEKRISDEKDTYARQELEKQLQYLEDRYRKDIDKFREAEAEKTRIASEAEQRRADAAIAAYNRAYSEILSSQQSGLGNLSGTIETLAARMEAAIEASAYSSSRRQS